MLVAIKLQCAKETSGELSKTLGFDDPPKASILEYQERHLRICTWTVDTRPDGLHCSGRQALSYVWWCTYK